MTLFGTFATLFHTIAQLVRTATAQQPTNNEWKYTSNKHIYDVFNGVNVGSRHNIGGTVRARLKQRRSSTSRFAAGHGRPMHHTAPLSHDTQQGQENSVRTDDCAALTARGRCRPRGDAVRTFDCRGDQAGR